MATGLHIDLARETDALDLEEFARGIGLSVRRDGTAIDILDERERIGETVMTWVAGRRAPVVPTPRRDGSLVLRPPAD